MELQSTYETVLMMERYGGSFVSKLASCWYVADAENKALLESTFKHIFDRYAEMVRQEKQRNES